jgi:succinate dehydrogenase cytochrome b556 subunit
MQKIISRPLSPHLTIYKPQLTSTLSIFHRISGVSLSLSFILLFFFYSFCSHYFILYSFYSFFIQLLYSDILLWITISLFSLLLIALHYHASNGTRHILWDFGFFLDLKNVYITGIFSCTMAIIWLSINSLRWIYS